MRDVAPHVHVKWSGVARRLRACPSGCLRQAVSLRSAVLFDELDRVVVNVRIAPALALLLPAARFIAADHVDAIRARLLIRPDVPLAEVPRRVALPFQKLGDRDALAEAAIRRIRRVARGPLARHQPRARRAARHARRVELREACAIARESIDIRRARIRMPVTAEVREAGIIGEDEDDVRHCFRSLHRNGKGAKRRE